MVRTSATQSTPSYTSSWEGEGLEMLRHLGFAGQDQPLRRVRIYKRGLTSSQTPGDVVQAVTAPLPHPTARRTRSRERPGSGASISAAALLRRWRQR